jgi:hypothetical protein
MTHNDNYFGECMWGIVELKGCKYGWILPTTSDSQATDYIVTRPCIDVNTCMSELHMQAAVHEIDIDSGTRV